MRTVIYDCHIISWVLLLIAAIVNISRFDVVAKAVFHSKNIQSENVTILKMNELINGLFVGKNCSTATATVSPTWYNHTLPCVKQFWRTWAINWVSFVGDVGVVVDDWISPCVIAWIVEKQLPGVVGAWSWTSTPFRMSCVMIFCRQVILCSSKKTNNKIKGVKNFAVDLFEKVPLL